MSFLGRARLLSSCQGRIEAILLVYPGQTTPASVQEYQAIEQGLGAGRTIFRFRQEVPTFKLKLSNLESRQAQEDHRFRKIFDLKPGMKMAALLGWWKRELESVGKTGTLTFRRWAQDPLLVLEWGGVNILVDKNLCSYHDLEKCSNCSP